MDTKELLELFKKYGIDSSIISGSLVFIWFILKSSWFLNILNKASEKVVEMFFTKKTYTGTDSKNTEQKKISEVDITNHDLFNYIDFWLYSKVPTFVFSSDYRSAVFKKYLIIYLKKHKELIKTYITDKKYQVMDESELWHSLHSLINNIMYEYEKEAELAGIPSVVINKMKLKNNDTISLTIDLLEGICNSRFYSSDKNLLKIYSILNILLSILDNTISNSENVCDSINGALKGKSFEGFTEPS